MEMSGAVRIVLILGVVAFVLVRRLIGERATARRMVVLPAALSGCGRYAVFGSRRGYVRVR